jgi:hypothetical protein
MMISVSGSRQKISLVPPLDGAPGHAMAQPDVVPASERIFRTVLQGIFSVRYKTVYVLRPMGRPKAL